MSIANIRQTLAIFEHSKQVSKYFPNRFHDIHKVSGLKALIGHESAWLLRRPWKEPAIFQQ